MNISEMLDTNSPLTLLEKLQEEYRKRAHLIDPKTFYGSVEYDIPPIEDIMRNAEQAVEEFHKKALRSDIPVSTVLSLVLDTHTRLVQACFAINVLKEQTQGMV